MNIRYPIYEGVYRILTLDDGNRNIYKEYISFRCYRGKVIPGIERRRKEEFELFYMP